jgi:hypothetical protein
LLKTYNLRRIASDLQILPTKMGENFPQITSENYLSEIFVVRVKVLGQKQKSPL